jgi:putative hydrolase of the HAD superfamily
MAVKVVGFDLFDTLVKAEAEAAVCIGNVCRKLQRHHIHPTDDEFRRTYRDVSLDYRRARHATHREVSNRVWLTEVLDRLGYDLDVTSPPIVEAVRAYFDPWKLTVYDDARDALVSLRDTHRMGLISNFTDGAFLRGSLRRLRLEAFFECVVVSEEVGWRKPHPHIFETFLSRMGAAPRETLFVGDDAVCDVQGAQDAGMQTAWIVRACRPSTRVASGARPDHTIHSLAELPGILQTTDRRPKRRPGSPPRPSSTP